MNYNLNLDPLARCTFQRVQEDGKAVSCTKEEFTQLVAKGDGAILREWDIQTNTLKVIFIPRSHMYRRNDPIERKDK